jgi:hypothetical protein
MKISIYIILTLIFITLFSCTKDFLEEPPSLDLDEDKVFSNTEQTLALIATTYQISIPQGYPLINNNNDGVYYSFRRLTGSVLAAACDEGDAVETWSEVQAWNTGTVLPTNIDWKEDNFHQMRWRAVRNCNIILERVDEVPDASAEFKNQAKGESYFLRALCHFEAFKRYGGIPLIKTKLSSSDDLYIPRSTVEETVNFILEDCAEALKLLPATQPANWKGRADKGCVLALKARLLLYAASPLFNTATPYMSFDDASNNTLICYGNYDQNRWKLAADASKAVLDWAAANGCSLLTGYGVDHNYEMLTVLNQHSEIILANQAKTNFNGTAGTWDLNERMMSILTGKWSGSTYSDGGVNVPMNFIRYYEKKDGTPQTWNNSGDDLMDKYSELDPRFNQSIGHHGGKWSDGVGVLSMFQGSQHVVNGHGHWMRKLIMWDMANTSQKRYVTWIVFRLGEFYLNYAEALNEFNGTPPSEAYTAVKAIRERSGMPAFPSGLTKEQFREKLRNERAIELAFEEHRFWDIRRWLIAKDEGVMSGAFYGIKVSDAGNSKVHYEKYVFENRTWYDKMYLHPFLQSEVNKYAGKLPQNPGW